MKNIVRVLLLCVRSLLQWLYEILPQTRALPNVLLCARGHTLLNVTLESTKAAQPALRRMGRWNPRMRHWSHDVTSVWRAGTPMLHKNGGRAMLQREKLHTNEALESTCVALEP